MRFSLVPIQLGLFAVLVGAVLVAPARSQSVAETLTVGAGAYAVAVNPVTNKIYVTLNNPSGTVMVIDGATNAMTSIPVGSKPESLDINTVTNRIYVGNYADGTVSVIDGNSNAVVATVATGPQPSQVVVNAKANTIYAMSFSVSGTEAVIDGATNAVVDQIFGGYTPTYIAVDPTTDMLYIDAVANNDYPGATLPTLYSAKGLVPNVPVSNGFDTIAQVLSGPYVYSMAADPVTDQVIIAGYKGTGLFVANMDSQGLATSYKQVSTANYLLTAVNAVSGTGYALGGQATLDAVNLATYVDTPINAGNFAVALAVDPNANAVYVANSTHPGTVNVVDG